MCCCCRCRTRLAGTYLPKAINPIHAKEPVNDMATAGKEAKAVMTGAVEDLLAKTGEGAGVMRQHALYCFWIAVIGC